MSSITVDFWEFAQGGSTVSNRKAGTNTFNNGPDPSECPGKPGQWVRTLKLRYDFLSHNYEKLSLDFKTVYLGQSYEKIWLTIAHIHEENDHSYDLVTHNLEKNHGNNL